MQEYKRQVDRESRLSSNGSHGSPNGGDGIQAIGRSSHKMIEAVMQSAGKGKVKRSCSLVFSLPFFLGLTSALTSTFGVGMIIPGSNYSTRLSLKTFIKLER